MITTNRAPWYPQDVRVPTALRDWKFPNLYFSSQGPAVKFHRDLQEHKEQGVKHYRVFQKFPLHFKPHLSLKTRDFQELGTNRAIPAIYSFVFFQMLFFPKNFSGYAGHVSVILSIDKIELVCALQVQNANEHINKIKAGPNLDLITQSQGKGLLIKYLSLFRPPLNFLQLLSLSHFFVKTRAVCGDCPVATECPI